MRTVTPLRTARADALWRHLAGREACANVSIEHQPEDRRDGWRKTIAANSEAVGVLGALQMMGGPASETGESMEAYHSWGRHFIDLDALSVAAVTRHLVREADWKARDVEQALNDLAHDERVRLVAESDSGVVGIELLKRPDDENAA